MFENEERMLDNDLDTNSCFENFDIENLSKENVITDDMFYEMFKSYKKYA